jgi:hypothetical protein
MNGLRLLTLEEQNALAVLADAAWTALTTITVPANATTEYFAGSVSGTFQARISTPVTGGTVTVLAIRPEGQQGWSRRL